MHQMPKRQLTKAEQEFCADPKNLTALRKRWDEALHRNFDDRVDAHLLLSTALWWHREKLIGAYMQSQLRPTQ